MNPLYTHTIPEDETTFLGSANQKDYYYRKAFGEDSVDVRFSNKPANYSTWRPETLFGMTDVPHDIRLAFHRAKDGLPVDECVVTITDEDGRRFTKAWDKTADRRDMIRWTLESSDLPHVIDAPSITTITIT